MGRVGPERSDFEIMKRCPACDGGLERLALKATATPGFAGRLVPVLRGDIRRLLHFVGSTGSARTDEVRDVNCLLAG